MKALAIGTGAVALFASLAAPAQARADEPAPGYAPPHVVPYTGGSIPADAHLEERANVTIIGTGLSVLAVPYGFSVLYALGTCGAQMACRQGSQWLYVPVVGPFVTATQAPTSGGQALSVFDGVLQTIGAAIALAGAAMPRSVVVWQDRSAALRLTPAPIPGGAGLSMTLTHL
jgi:hypothetical protein